MSDTIDYVLDNKPSVNQNIYKRKTSHTIKKIFALVTPYWKSEEKVLAWGLLAAVIALNMCTIYIAVIINDWYAEFYNALQTLDKAKFSGLLFKFLTIVMFAVVVFVAAQFTQAYLAFRWRMWLTKKTASIWLENNNFARLFTYQYKTENPDQRISQDINLFTSKGLDLSISILTESVKCVTFAVILWTLSSSLALPLPGGKQVAIPGYMLWFTIIYVSIASVVIYKSGKPLINLDYSQEKVEANFRFNLMRVRERRDEISILQGGDAESQFFKQNLKEIINNFNKIIKRNIFVNSFQNIFNNLSTILPILAAAPMFFSGVITLGVLMQISNAFGKVESAMMIFALNFQTFASWQATFNRLSDFEDEVESLKNNVKNNDALNIRSVPNNSSLIIRDLVLNLPGNQNLKEFNFNVDHKERVLIMGRSGLGKSTLFKCIAELWPYASGTIIKPKDLLVIPQKPYFPINTLRNCLLYPHINREVSDAELYTTLELCNLEVLKGRLDEVADWLSILSLGEQQRLNFAKILIAKPNWVLLDEPTASMDKPLESKLFTLLLKQLPNITLLTIGHAPSLKDFHTRVIEV